MRRPHLADLFLTFQGGLGIAFFAVVVFGLGDWAGVWS
ncbi:MAG: hypothetical protein DK306_002370 [Chloroflexi bacterium]|jgi:hypothetical protein|nr:MAG: hypothetical protein DK306_002370 [Chloroflexota bacterium]